MEDFESLNDVWGDPEEYKGVKLYPIKMKNCIEFYKNIDCLLINKNQIQDVDIIRMSYLDFLFRTKFETNEYWDKLNKILELVLREQIFQFGYDKEKNGVIIEVYENSESVGVTIPTIITGFSFNQIRKIILNQNLIEFDDGMLNPELQKKINKARELIRKRNGKSATMKEQITAYHCAIGESYESIKNLTIYQFLKGIERENHIRYSDISGIAISTGMASTDKPISWIDHIEEQGIYDDVLMDENDFNKISSKLTGDK